MELPSNSCPRCRKTFAYECRLRKHLSRKTPCDVVVQNDEDRPHEKKGEGHICRFCNRGYATLSNLYRHQRSACRAADKSDVKLLYEETKQQLEEQKRTTELLQKKLEELPALILRQLALAERVDGSPVQNLAQQNGGQQINAVDASTTNAYSQSHNSTTHIEHVHVDARTFVMRSFMTEIADGGPLRVELEDVRALFVGPSAHPALKAWMEAPPDDRYRLTDEVTTLAAEALVAMVQAVHERCPEQRNVYLNPARADQVKVYERAEGCVAYEPKSWTVMPLRVAILRLCDGLAHQLNQDVNRDSDKPEKVAALCGEPRPHWHDRVYMQDGVGTLPLFTV